jgi:hypothetical protein
MDIMESAYTTNTLLTLRVVYATIADVMCDQYTDNLCTD